MEEVVNKTFDSERALYESNSLLVRDCRFCGEADGESALKESKDIKAEGCFFDLRYPFWHDENVEILNCKMTECCRAPLWYTKNVAIKGCEINGTKAIRECEGVSVDECRIVSDELGWDTLGIKINNTYAKGAYMMSRAKDIDAVGLEMEGKYSFQYIENATFDGCTFNTKDAFWHAKNVRVKNSVIKGEYLGWYSQGLTLENCTIEGTQPLCYCKDLTLINCKMYGCDLAFEKSCVNAEITTPVISIKNVLSGAVSVPDVDRVIKDKDIYMGEIKVLSKECN